MLATKQLHSDNTGCSLQFKIDAEPNAAGTSLHLYTEATSANSRLHRLRYPFDARVQITTPAHEIRADRLPDQVLPVLELLAFVTTDLPLALNRSTPTTPNFQSLRFCETYLAESQSYCNQVALVKEAVFAAHVQELNQYPSSHTGIEANLATFLQSGIAPALPLERERITPANAVIAYTGGKESRNVDLILNDLFKLDLPYWNIYDGWHTRSYGNQASYMQSGLLRKFVVASLDSCEITPTFSYGGITGQGDDWNLRFGFCQPVPIAFVQRLLLLLKAAFEGKEYVFVGDELERQQVWLKDGRVFGGHDYYQSQWLYSQLNYLFNVTTWMEPGVTPLRIVSPVCNMAQPLLIGALERAVEPYNSCCDVEFGKCGKCYACKRIDFVVRSIKPAEPNAEDSGEVVQMDNYGYKSYLVAGRKDFVPVFKPIAELVYRNCDASLLYETFNQLENKRKAVLRQIWTGQDDQFAIWQSEDFHAIVDYYAGLI